MGMDGGFTQIKVTGGEQEAMAERRLGAPVVSPRVPWSAFFIAEAEGLVLRVPLDALVNDRARGNRVRPTSEAWDALLLGRPLIGYATVPPELLDQKDDLVVALFFILPALSGDDVALVSLNRLEALPREASEIYIEGRQR